MASPNPFQHPTFVRIKEKYRALKQPYKQLQEEFETKKESIWYDSSEYRLLCKLKRLPRFKGITLIISGILAFVLLGEIGALGFLIFLPLLLYSIALKLIDNISEGFKDSVLQRSSKQLMPYEEKTSIAKSELDKLQSAYDAEWEAACETYAGYPPDWKERCEKVKLRDGYKCTECGYPDGFQRMSRELHVHHKKSLLDGGRNSLGNLVTLCHICHRKVDKRHSRIRKNPFGRAKAKKSRY